MSVFRKSLIIGVNQESRPEAGALLRRKLSKMGHPMQFIDVPRGGFGNSITMGRGRPLTAPI